MAHIKNKSSPLIVFPLIFFIIATSLFLFPKVTFSLNFKKLVTVEGLTLLHVERKALPIINLTLLIKASPLNEIEYKHGVANLTAKMLKEGTLKRSSSEISEELEFLGASLDISVNRDYTTITLSILKKDVEKGFEILSDILLNPSFPENELKRKKEIIKGTLKQRKEDPSFVARKIFLQKVFPSHPYGRPIEGEIELIDSIERDELIKFYEEFYLPKNSIISIVGDITELEINYLVKKYFVEWFKRKNSVKITKACNEKENQKNKTLTGSNNLILINKDITQANIIIGHKGISRDNPDYYDVILMNYILGGGGFASKLMKTIRDKMGLTYSIYSSFSANKEAGEFFIEVQTKNESAREAIKEILKEIEKMQKELVSDQEIEDAKAFLIGSFPRRLDTGRKIADFLALMQFYNLGDDFIKKYPEYIDKITKESVQKAALKYLNLNDYLLVIVGNKEKIGDLTDIK